MEFHARSLVEAESKGKSGQILILDASDSSQVSYAVDKWTTV